MILVILLLFGTVAAWHSMISYYCSSQVDLCHALILQIALDTLDTTVQVSCLQSVFMAE